MDRSCVDGSHGKGAPAALTLRLFGRLEARVQGVTLPRLRTRKGEWLLALLALRAAPVDRERQEVVILTIGIKEGNRLMSYSPRLRAILEKPEQQIRDGLGIEHDEFWRQVEADTHADRS